MKSPFRTFIVACLTAMSMTTSAQSTTPTIEQAFDNFASFILKKDYVTASESTTFNDKDEECTNITLSFALPKKKSAEFDHFNDALTQNSTKAYKSLRKKANSKADNKLTFLDGENNSKTIVFGAKADYNYNVLMERSKEKSIMHKVYALVWKNSNDSIFGSVYKTYGMEPQSRTTDNGMPIPRSSADFMQQFYNSSDLFLAIIKDFDQWKNSAEQVNRRRLTLSATANLVMRLCKEYNFLIKSDDRQMVKQTLAKMISSCHDDSLYAIANLLKSAQNSLK